LGWTTRLNDSLAGTTTPAMVIEMPGRNGFEFLEALPPPHPHVIFTTAYDEFAIRAFEVSALDYLLKPIHPQRLAASLDKLKNWRGPDENLDSPPAALTEPDAIDKGGSDVSLREDDRVFARTGDRCWFVAIRSIRLLEAEDNYTRAILVPRSRSCIVRWARWRRACPPGCSSGPTARNSST